MKTWRVLIKETRLMNQPYQLVLEITERFIAPGLKPVVTEKILNYCETRAEAESDRDRYLFFGKEINHIDKHNVKIACNLS